MIWILNVTILYKGINMCEEIEKYCQNEFICYDNVHTGIIECNCKEGFTGDTCSIG